MRDAPVILAVKPGSLSRKDRRVLSAAGVIVIEHERPEEVRPIRVDYVAPDPGAMARLAMEALASVGVWGDDARKWFLTSLASAMKPQPSISDDA